MFMRILLLLLLCSPAGLPGTRLLAQERTGARDQRVLIIESGLRDLSEANEAALARQRVDPVPSSDALGAPRVRLEPRPPADASERVRAEIQSSLHRLRRESVSAQTEDSRKVIVDDMLERQAGQHGASGKSATDTP